jgi:hypothetical protein
LPTSDIGLVKRELPFGEHPRRSKRARYKIGDPFLRYWYRFVDPNLSLLEARQLDVQTKPAWLTPRRDLGGDRPDQHPKRLDRRRVMAAGAGLVGRCSDTSASAMECSPGGIGALAQPARLPA